MVGNMYPGVKTVNPLNGPCGNLCKYCSTLALGEIRPNVKACYTGEVRLNEKVLGKRLGKDKTYFVCNCVDLFGPTVPDEYIRRIIDWLKQSPGNHYMIQTKCPNRLLRFKDELLDLHRTCRGLIIGTTIETDDEEYLRTISKAPAPWDRATALSEIRAWCPRTWGVTTFVTIEPVIDFEYPELLDMILQAQPNYVNIGADSKLIIKLPEPSWEQVEKLINSIRYWGIEVREKTNLDRLRKASP